MEEEKTIVFNHKEHLASKEDHPFWELIRFAIVALLIVVPIRAFVAQPFIVSGSSMYPTFEDGNYLIVDEISYRFEKPHRGDVIIFRYPKDKKKFFIKRVIGLPNETIEIKDSSVIIKNNTNPNGFILAEPYVKSATYSNLAVELEADEYFLMGDNRNASSDSRSWGNVKENLIVGRAFLQLLPLDEIYLLPGRHEFVE